MVEHKTQYIKVAPASNFSRIFYRIFCVFLKFFNKFTFLLIYILIAKIKEIDDLEFEKIVK